MVEWWAFGHAAFFGIGGYVLGILYQHAAERSEFLGLLPGTDNLLNRPFGGLAGGSGGGGGDRQPVAAHQRRAVHHDHPGVRADAVLPVRLAQGLWWRRCG